MKVLMLSGSGWLGSYITREFLEHGHEVTILSRGERAPGCGIQGANLVKCNRADLNDLKEKLQTYAEDIVIDVIPGYFGAENTKAVVEALQGRIKHYLHCSSTGVYTPLQSVPGRETDRVAPLEENGDAFIRKAASDQVIFDAVKEGFPGTVIQPTCIMGPGMFPMDNMGGRNPNFVRDMENGETMILPNGGSMLLQFVHPADLARAFRLAAENDGSIGRHYIISGQRSLTVKEYVHTMANLLGTKAKTLSVPADAILAQNDPNLSVGDFRFFLEHMSFDITRAREELGYEPSFTLEAMLNDLIGWTKQKYSEM